VKTFTPLGDNVLVRPIPAPVARKTGVVNPNSQEEKPTRGTVIAVGPGVLDHSICVGCEVGWRKYAGVEIPVDGEVLSLFREDEICGLWEEDDA
jgi:chaperonin GroES